MLGLNGSDLKEALSLSESVRRGLEEMASAKSDQLVLHEAASKFEMNVGASIEESVRLLRRLEAAINDEDQETISDVNDTVDSIVDYLVVVLCTLDEEPDRGGGARLRIERVRRDAGRLAQYVCQMAENAP